MNLTPLTHSINDLADGKSGGYSVFLGSGAGINDDASNNYNVALGVDALKTNTSGSSNTALGSSALFSNTTGINNTASGAVSLYSNTVGYSNAAYGYNSMALNDSGYRNTANGVDAAYYNLNGHDNVAMGWRSLYYNFNGHQNIAIGNESSFWNNSGNNNTVIGTGADYWNSSGSSELKVRDEAGNVTTLSPHNFSMIEKSEPMAWSFYSENHAAGQKINVDMLRAIRLVEEISGEKLAVIENLDAIVGMPTSDETNPGIIREQQLLIDELLKRVEELERICSEKVND